MTSEYKYYKRKMIWFKINLKVMDNTVTVSNLISNNEEWIKICLILTLLSYVSLVRKRSSSKDRQIHTLGKRDEVQWTILFRFKESHTWLDDSVFSLLLFWNNFRFTKSCRYIYIYIFHPHYETVNILEPFENRFYTW